MNAENEIMNSVDEIQLYILENLFSKGENITTRELKTIELCNINLCLANPRNRVTYNPIRKWKLPLAIGEFAWHISGSNNLEFISYYAKQWKEFSIDGKLISQSCYGHKIFNKDRNDSCQWDNLINLLKIDKFSRRAVLYFNDFTNELDYFSKDIACVSTVQFLIRNGKLDAIVTMRSNDIIWGLPYDIYLFTMLQELLSLQLNVELGNYYHNVGSMHIYEKHFKLGQEMLAAVIPLILSPSKMDYICSNLDEFLKFESLIRTSNISLDLIQSLSISQYWETLLIELWKYKIEKTKKV